VTRTTALALLCGTVGCAAVLEVLHKKVQNLSSMVRAGPWKLESGQKIWGRQVPLCTEGEDLVHTRKSQ
jgi:hypothetical protein